MSLHILVGLQEQSLALVFFRFHWNAGTRNRSDPQRLVVLRSGPPMTCDTVSRRNVKTFQRHSRSESLIIKQPFLTLSELCPPPFSFQNPPVNKIFLKYGPALASATDQTRFISEMAITIF